MKRKVTSITPTPEDAFHIAGEYFEHTGKALGISPKKNVLLKTEQELESKMHMTHSSLARLESREAIMGKKPYIDIPTLKLKAKLRRIK